MSTVVSNEGSYKGLPKEWGLELSSGGFPTFVVKFEAHQWWNPDENDGEGEWMEWLEYDEVITAYMVLFGGEGKPTKNCEQLMEVLGWDGSDFDALEDADYSETMVQFRCAEETYKDKTHMRMQWLSPEDATPGGGVGTVEKMDKDARKAMTAKFQKELKKLSGGKVKTAKPKSAKPKAAPKAAPKSEPITPEDIEEEAVKQAPPKRGKAKVTVEYTYESAWDAVLAGTKHLEDDDRAEVWSEMLQTCAPDTDEDDITSDVWSKIVKNVIKAAKVSD